MSGAETMTSLHAIPATQASVAPVAATDLPARDSAVIHRKLA
jgi:hypothetical protein